MKGLAIAGSTQTPLLRFDDAGSTPGSAGEGLPPRRSEPGRICPMFLPTVQEMLEAGLARKCHWYTLNPGAFGVVLDQGRRGMRHAPGPAYDVRQGACCKAPTVDASHARPPITSLLDAAYQGFHDGRFRVRTLLDTAAGLELRA